VGRPKIGKQPKRTTIWLADADREAIRRVREKWRLDTDSAAIRFAIRVLAQAERLDIVVPEKLLKEVDDGV